MDVVVSVSSGHGRSPKTHAGAFSEMTSTMPARAPAIGDGGLRVQASASSSTVVVGTARRGCRQPVDVEIIIPSFNESARLPYTLARSVEYLREQPWSSRSSSSTTAASTRPRRSPERPPRKRARSRSWSSAARGRGRAPRCAAACSPARRPSSASSTRTSPPRWRRSTRPCGPCQPARRRSVASRYAPGAQLVRRPAAGPPARRLGVPALARPLVPGVARHPVRLQVLRRDAVQRSCARCENLRLRLRRGAPARRSSRTAGSIVEIPVDWTDDAGSTFRPVHDGLRSFGAVLGLRGSFR